MVKEEYAERLAFLGLTPTDLHVLGSMGPLFERHADSLVAAFYRHLLSFDETRALLSDPAVTGRLLTKQRAYLVSLACPQIGEDYIEDRIRIGQVHSRIGLQPRWYLGAYALYFSLLAPILWQEYRHEPERCLQALTALTRLLLFDVQLAMEAYIEQEDAGLTHLNRELAEMSRSLAREYQAQGAELRETTQRARAAEDLASMATLVAGLAHEIGTPMGVIRGHAEALSGAVEGDKAQWRLRTILEQIDRISNIIRSLLNVARPREATVVAVDLEQTLDSALAFLSEKLRRRGVEVDRRYAPVPVLAGDPDKLQQLFLNLFLNAVDAMPEGGRLMVSLAAEGDGILVRVADTGVGIAPMDLDHVFKPFFTTKPAGRGSGLGLVVAQGIVTDHGGTLEVSSEPGRGTEFSIHLPADRHTPPRSTNAS